MSQPAPVFELEKVSFDYDGIPALREISLAISSGERVALLGANGSGKSTLLRMLDALCFPSQGSVRFEGQPLSRERLNSEDFNRKFRRKVALVFQNADAQLFNPTVYDEITFGPLQMEWSAEETIQRVDRVMRFMQIAHLRERPPYRLSGGEKKRVALACVLVLDPQVLLLDEPTESLDPRSQSHLIDLLQEWKGSGKTVITATHHMEVLEDIADRAFILDAGSLIAEGKVADLLRDQELLVRANLIHAHRHSHGAMQHTHPHLTRHSHSSDHS